MNGLTTISKFNYSAVLTVFNAEDTVSRAIIGIQKQIFPPKQIIIIDDQSSDGSCEIVEAFAALDPRIIFFKAEKNQGQAHNRNLGVELSNTEFILFFDDDDLSLPERSVNHQNMFEMKADVSYVSSQIEYLNGYKLIAQNDYFLGTINEIDLSRHLLLGKTFENHVRLVVPASTLAIRKRVFNNNVGFDPALRRLEDVDLAIKCSEIGLIFAFSPEISVRRFSTLSSDKGQGIDMKFEKSLISKYKHLLTSDEYTYAINHCRTRELYFSRNFILIFLHLLVQPRYAMKMLRKTDIVISRLLHDLRKW